MRAAAMVRQTYNSNKLLHVCVLKCIAMLEFVRAIRGAPTLHYGGIPTMLRKQARTLCSQSVQQQSVRAIHKDDCFASLKPDLLCINRELG